MSTQVRRRLVPALAVISVLGLVAALVISGVVQQRGAALGHPELATSASELAMYLTIMVSTGAVGYALAVARPRHPVGWCFLGLTATIAFAGLGEAYATHVLIVAPGSGPLGSQVAILCDGIWLPWFGLISAIIALTPTGRPVSRPWGWVLALTSVDIALAFSLHLLQRPSDLDAPFAGITSNPWTWDSALPVIDVLVRTLTWAAGLGPILAAGALFVRYRRSRGEERQQLKWLSLAVVPLPLLIIVSYIASITDQYLVLDVATAGYLVVIPVSAWLSISRFRLYDVDRVLSQAVSWGLLSLALVAIYTGIVLLTTLALRGVTNGSQLAAGLAGVCAAALATPLHRRSQQAVDRRFNRRRFETISLIERFVSDAPSGPPVDEVLRTALADPSLRVAYAVQDADAVTHWVDAEGREVAEQFGAVVSVERGERTVARVWFDPARAGESLVRSAVALASGELENVALRSAVAVQLELVRQSRNRIVQAQHAERGRIERNLHDGAQQRLLAIAFDLGAARLRLQHTPGTEDVQARLESSVESLQTAVAELRSLANGLLPSALSGSGLSGALSELAGRTPVPLQITDTTGERRFAEPVEATAWFIALESVTNAVKHASSSTIEIALTSAAGRLVVEISDDGLGGADPLGNGLRGLADRAEAIGGSLAVLPRHPRGSLVRAELPCES